MKKEVEMILKNPKLYSARKVFSVVESEKERLIGQVNEWNQKIRNNIPVYVNESELMELVDQLAELSVLVSTLKDTNDAILNSESYEKVTNHIDFIEKYIDSTIHILEVLQDIDIFYVRDGV